MSIVKSGKGKIDLTEKVDGEVFDRTQEVKELYSEAINGNEAFGWTKPGHYDYASIMDAYQENKLYRPLAVSFGLV